MIYKDILKLFEERKKFSKKKPAQELQAPQPPPKQARAIPHVQFLFKHISITGVVSTPELEPDYQGQALRSLWQHVIDGLVFRHPDPAVDVRCSITDGGFSSVWGEFLLHNLASTDEPEYRFGHFHSGWAANHWPGAEVAEHYLLAAWACYVQHECLELVTRRTADNSYAAQHRVLCPHANSTTLTQQILEVGAHGGNQSVLRVLCWFLGEAVSRMMIDRNKLRAAQELANEIMWLKDPTCYA